MSRVTIALALSVWGLQAALAGQTPAATPALERTDWRLVRLGETAIAAAAVQTNPTLRLEGDPLRASESAGCNRFTGTYTTKGNTLTFSPLAATRMACPKGMDTENAYLAALANVRRWRIVQQTTLELIDARSRVLARFEPIK